MKRICFLLMVGVVFGWSGCAKSEPPSDLDEETKKLVGTWDVERSVVSVYIDGVLDDEDIAGGEGDWARFQNDGHYIAGSSANTIEDTTLKYSLSGDILTLTALDGSATYRYTVKELTATRLVMEFSGEYEEDGHVVREVQRLELTKR